MVLGFILILYKLGMVLYTYNPSTGNGMQRQEDYKFEVILDYIMSAKSVLAK